MTPSIKRSPTAALAAPGQSEDNVCPRGIKCGMLHNLDVVEETTRNSIQRISSSIVNQEDCIEFKEVSNGSKTEEDRKELILAALKVAGKIYGRKETFARKIRLAVKTVKLYEELFKSQGRQFCLYVLAEVLAKPHGSKSSEHRDTRRPQTMPDSVSQNPAPSNQVTIPINMTTEPSDMEPEGSLGPTAVLGPYQADPTICYRKGGTESKAKHPRNNVALAEEDPQNLDVAKSSAASTEPEPKRRGDIWWLIGIGVGAISLIACGCLYVRKGHRNL